MSTKDKVQKFIANHRQKLAEPRRCLTSTSTVRLTSVAFLAKVRLESIYDQFISYVEMK